MSIHKAVIADIDGCLTPESSVPWDFPLFSKLAARTHAWKKGGAEVFTLCTGRPQPYVECLMKLLDIHVPAVCENGAVIYTLDNNCARYGPGVTPETIAAQRKIRRYAEDVVLKEFPQIRIQFGKEVQLSLFNEDPAIFEAIKTKIEAFVKEQGLPPMTVQPSRYYLNVTPKTIDKGAAVREVLGMLKVKKEDAVGIGDTEGDLPLAREVGWFACPANAVDELKKKADYVSPYPMLEGVLDILDRPECKARS